MKFAVFVLTIVLISEALASDAHAKWNHHKQVHNKTYHNSEHEEKSRQKFMKMDKLIEDHNKQAAAGNATYFVDHNIFSDDISENPMKFKGLLSIDDLIKRQSKIIITPYKAKSTASALPANFDWRTQGWNVPVRNQGSCGCCWSFSVTASLEAQIFKKTGKIVTLSPQELIDCSSTYGTNGCHGARVTDGFAYIVDNGVTEEKNLPYQYTQSEDNTKSCPANIKTMNRYKISGVTRIPPGEHKLLKDALVNLGPIAIGIDTNSTAFKHYKGGFWNGYEMNSNQKCSSHVDHAVLLIGYGAKHPQSGKPYWIIKNQWGTTGWGDKGILYLADDGTDICGISIQAFIPNLV